METLSYFRAVEERDQDEVLHVWKRYHLDELPYTFTRVFLTEKPVRVIAPVLFVLFIVGLIDILRFELFCKVGCIFPMVISSEFRKGYIDDNHREDAPLY